MHGRPVDAGRGVEYLLRIAIEEFPSADVVDADSFRMIPRAKPLLCQKQDRALQRFREP